MSRNVISADDIKIGQFTDRQWMYCPGCGALTAPYGGFGDGEGWQSIGKYSCKPHAHVSTGADRHCGETWYGDPVTGEIVEPWSTGRILDRAGHRNVTNWVRRAPFIDIRHYDPDCPDSHWSDPWVLAVECGCAGDGDEDRLDRVHYIYGPFGSLGGRHIGGKEAPQEQPSLGVQAVVSVGIRGFEP